MFSKKCCGGGSTKLNTSEIFFILLLLHPSLSLSLHISNLWMHTRKFCIHHMHVVRVLLLQMKRSKNPQQWNWIELRRELTAYTKHTYRIGPSVWWFPTWIALVQCRWWLFKFRNKCLFSAKHTHIHSSCGMCVESPGENDEIFSFSIISTGWLTAFDDLQISFRSRFDKFEFNSPRHFYNVHSICTNNSARCKRKTEEEKMQFYIYAPFNRHYYRLKGMKWTTLLIPLNQLMTNVICIFAYRQQILYTLYFRCSKHRNRNCCESK